MADAPSAWEILRRFRHEKTDPEPFYVGLAARTVARFPHELEGAAVLDLGCGPGWYSTAMAGAGAEVVAVDLGGDDVRAAVDRGVAAMVGDAGRLALPDASFDGVFCSNLLEHVPDPSLVLAEIARVLRPGGWAWISWTPWFSPWGGHEIVPFHLLGPRLGPTVWNGLFGRPRTNVPYEGLWPSYVGAVLADAHGTAGLQVVDRYPRYYPSQRWIMSIPIVREFASWNAVIEARAG